MGCNAVVDINTEVLSIAGVREMLMVGTGSYNKALGTPKTPVTSELTGEELWNLTQMGYSPVRLVLGTSVYALGFAGGVTAMFKSLSRGEVNEITRLVYEARENALRHIEDDANANNADEVIGVKVFVHEIGSGLVEVLAIGTAIRKNAAMQTETEALLPQAIIRDRDTFFDAALTGSLSRDHENPTVKAPSMQGNPLMGMIVGLIIVSVFVMMCCGGVISQLF